jgi:hypothetical protein
MEQPGIARVLIRHGPLEKQFLLYPGMPEGELRDILYSNVQFNGKIHCFEQDGTVVPLSLVLSNPQAVSGSPLVIVGTEQNIDQQQRHFLKFELIDLKETYYCREEGRQ